MKEPATPLALKGVRVLDLSHGIAGPFAARLLGDYGADVVKIEKPETGDFCRRLEPLHPTAAAPEQSLLFQYLNWNKRSIALDLRDRNSHPLLRLLVESSDILIESFRPGTLASWGLGIDKLMAWNPRLVVTSITNFGQTGEYAQHEAGDLTFQAMGGIMSISGRTDREPLRHGLRQTLYCAGLNGAYASLAARLAASTDGVGEHVDLSIQECVASQMVINQPNYAFVGAVQGRRARVQDPFAGEPIACKEGFLAVQTGGGAPLRDFTDVLGAQEFSSPEWQSIDSRMRIGADKVRAVLAECLAHRNAHEVFLKASSRRLLTGVVQRAEDLLRCEQLEARGLFVEMTHPATGTYRFAGPMVNLSRTPFSLRRRSPLLNEHAFEIVAELDNARAGANTGAPRKASPARTSPSLPLAGLRVLDLSYVFAAPYMASLMAGMGAEVIKVEAPHRLDQTRRSFGPYLNNKLISDAWNRSGCFHQLNSGKKSLSLDLGSEEGRDILWKLIDQSDFVIENFTPRVMRKWGMSYESLAARRPSLIMLSNTGYGSTGPWSAFPSQGTTLEATMGITNYTGYRDDKPWKVGQSYPDFIAAWTGLGAAMVALQHRRQTGLGQWIDLGMYQAGAALIPEAWLNQQLGQPDLQRIGNEDHWNVPSNLYAAKGKDQWVAVSVFTDAQWAALSSILGPQTQEPRFATREGRRGHRAEIDKMVAAWVLGRDKTEVTKLLQERGIAAGPLMNNRDLLLDAHMRQRGLYEMVEHAAPIGPRPIIGRPWKASARHFHIPKGAPRFGEDGAEVLERLAGIDAGAFASLLARGVVALAPTVPQYGVPLNVEASLKEGTLTAMDADYEHKLGLDKLKQPEEIP